MTLRTCESPVAREVGVPRVVPHGGDTGELTRAAGTLPVHPGEDNRVPLVLLKVLVGDGPRGVVLHQAAVGCGDKGPFSRMDIPILPCSCC